MISDSSSGDRGWACHVSNLFFCVLLERRVVGKGSFLIRGICRGEGGQIEYWHGNILGLG